MYVDQDSYIDLMDQSHYESLIGWMTNLDDDRNQRLSSHLKQQSVFYQGNRNFLKEVCQYMIDNDWYEDLKQLHSCRDVLWLKKEDKHHTIPEEVDPSNLLIYACERNKSLAVEILMSIQPSLVIIIQAIDVCLKYAYISCLKEIVRKLGTSGYRLSYLEANKTREEQLKTLRYLVNIDWFEVVSQDSWWKNHFEWLVPAIWNMPSIMFTICKNREDKMICFLLQEWLPVSKDVITYIIQKYL